jgi:gliding motility-associated-like protein
MIAVCGLTSALCLGQDVSLYQQFNGRYDFTFIGNTLNTEENGNFLAPCSITTASDALLSLQPDDQIEKAFLYWAGSGPGDLEVKLNDVTLFPDRTFNVTQVTSISSLIFFSAFKDITQQVQQTGNGLYTLSELDLTEVIPAYCPNRTNFGGWAILIVYKNENLPLNQLNVYDGLQFVSQFQPELTIDLDNLNVIDNQNAKIGFIAWEGDKGIAVNETLQINGNVISNPPLNPANNAFNGTNSITGSDQLYNMDLDIYDVQNNINVGDVAAQIKMTSGQDFVMINTVVTKFNSQLPDATINFAVDIQCDSRLVQVAYTISNLESTDEFPAQIPVSVYVNQSLVLTFYTEQILAIGESLTGILSIVIPDEISSPFELLMVVDDQGENNGIQLELNENNNEFAAQVTLSVSPVVPQLADIYSCNQGFGVGVFDLTGVWETASGAGTASLHTSESDAILGINPISNLSNFPATAPQQIFVRVSADGCFTVGSFSLLTRNCPPVIFNYVSVNGDGVNDEFVVDGLQGVFTRYKIEIYNRWGRLIFSGGPQTPNWDGRATKGLVIGSKNVPDGTYYYVIHLNDPDYTTPLVGFLYITR